MIKILAVLFLVGLFSLLPRQSGTTTYSGLEQRPVKSLSSQQLDGFLAGKGMGFAKAAELNHFPGPKHVLELADELKLSQEQTAQTSTIFREMQQDARRLGRRYVALEAALDNEFRLDRIDEASLESLVTELAGLRGKIRLCHLAAHLKTRRVLTGKQIALYDELRGYVQDAAHEMNHSN